MKKLFLICFLLVICQATIYSGDFTFSKPELTGKYRALLGTDSEFTYMAILKGNKMRIQKHKNSNSRPVKEQEVKLVSGGILLDFFTSFSANGYVYIITKNKDKKNKTVDFYIHKLSSSLTLSEGVLIGKIWSNRIIELQKKFKYGGSSLNFSLSPNNKLFHCFSYFSGGKLESKDRRSVLLGSEAEIIEDINFQLPYNNNEFNVIASDIDNSGILYVLGNKYEQKGFLSFSSTTIDSDIWLYKIDTETGEHNSITIKITESCFGLNFKITRSGNIVFTALTGNNNSGVSGATCIVYDSSLKEVNRSTHKFEDSFITQSWTDKEKKKLEQKENRAAKNGKEGPNLNRYNYSIDYVLEGKDGSITMLGEQYKVVERTTTTTNSSGQMQTKTTSYFYYMDIIAVNFNANGIFEWKQNIKKEQRAVNNTTYLSYFPFVDGDKISMVYSAKNYDDRKSLAKIYKVDLNPDGAIEKGTVSGLSKAESHKLLLRECYQTTDGTVVLYVLPKKGTRIGIMAQD